MQVGILLEAMMNNSTSQTKIPLLDFFPFTSPTSDPSQRLRTAKQLVHACHTTGFVTITNHGVSPALLSTAFTWSKRLFDLIMEEKMLAPHPEGPSVHRGYSYPGLEKVSQVVSDDVEVGEKLREVRDCKVRFDFVCR